MQLFFLKINLFNKTRTTDFVSIFFFNTILFRLYSTKILILFIKKFHSHYQRYLLSNISALPLCLPAKFNTVRADNSICNGKNETDVFYQPNVLSYSNTFLSNIFTNQSNFSSACISIYISGLVLYAHNNICLVEKSKEFMFSSPQFFNNFFFLNSVSPHLTFWFIKKW